MSMMRGNVRTGSLHSSAMFTESSKPTMAKNASVVAATTEVKAPPPLESRSVTREKSASPLPPPLTAQMPIRMMISSPDSSTQVNTTLAFTLSLTPRRLRAATRRMKPMAIRVTTAVPASNEKPSTRLAANAFDAVDADVTPDDMTAKATMNVTNWIPNALCVYSAAPAACGYLVTSSR